MRNDEDASRYRLRQEDVAPVDQMRRLPVTCLGAGAIGGNFCLLGGKLGFDITVYDGDTVAPENLNSQMYGLTDLGRPKVEALQARCALLAAAEIRAIHAFATGGEPVTGVVIDTLDSMASRKTIWENVILPRTTFVEAVVSVRMGAESGSIFTVRPGVARERIWYEANGLYGDAESLPLPCTNRATSYCTSIAAALAVYQVKRIMMRQRPIFRRIEFDLDGFMFVVEE